MSHRLTKKLRQEVRQLKKELKEVKRNECRNRLCPRRLWIDFEGLEKHFSVKNRQ